MNKSEFAIGSIVLFLVLAAFTFFSSFKIIGPGERGVIISRISGTNMERVMGEGFNFKLPWVEWVETMSVQKERFTTQADASSKDLQDVQTTVTLNYSLVESDLPKMRSRIGLSFEDKVIVPVVQEIVKAVMANYTAADLIHKRQQVRKDMGDLFRSRLSDSYINFMDVSIVNFQFSQAYDDAIEAKQVAEQQALQEEKKKERIIIAAQAKKRERELAAEAHLFEETRKAEAILIMAKKQAEANRALNESITSQLLQLFAVQSWDGILPKVMGQGGVVPFLDITKSIDK